MNWALAMVSAVMAVVAFRRFRQDRSPFQLSGVLFWVSVTAGFLSGESWLLWPAMIFLGIKLLGLLPGFRRRLGVKTTPPPTRRSPAMVPRPGTGTGAGAAAGAPAGPALRRRLRLEALKRSAPELFGPGRPAQAEAGGEPRRAFLPASPPLEFPVVDRGVLRLGPGGISLGLRARLEAGPESPEGPDPFTLELETPDAEGRRWRIDAAASSSGLLMIALREGLDRSYYDDAPEEWRSAFRTAPLLRGVRLMADWRDRHRLRVGEDEIEIHLKYRSAVFDLALDAGEPGRDPLLLVLTLGLLDAEGDEIPPFITTLPLREFLAAPREASRWSAAAGDWVPCPPVEAVEVGSSADREERVVFVPR